MRVGDALDRILLESIVADAIEALQDYLEANLDEPAVVDVANEHIEYDDA